MATLYIRNVPEEIVAILKERARLNGRSLNAEVVLLLSEVPARPKRSIDEVVESVRRRAERMNLPEEVRDDMVEGIRRARDERAAHIERLVEGDD